MRKLGVNRIGTIVFSVIIVFCTLLMVFDILDGFDFFFRDALYQKERTVDSDIVILAIDDESLEVLGKWPWPRDYHGQLLEKIDSASPRAIGFDVLFLEEGDDDGGFIESLSRLSGKPIFAGFGTLSEDAEPGLIRPMQFHLPFKGILPYLEVAHINTIPDSDGIVRRGILGLDVGKDGNQTIVDSLAYKIYEAAYDRKPDCPVDAWNRMYIRFSGRTGAFERVPYYMVLTGEVDPEYFRDKVVLIGVTAIGLADDYYFTPIDRAYPMYGIEVHANIIQQMADGLTWTEANKWVEFAILLGISLLSVLIQSKLRLLFSTLAMILIAGIYIGIAVLLSRLQRGVVLGIVYVVLAVVLIYIANNVIRYVAELIERKRVTDVFSKYMEPRLVDKLLKGGEEALGLGGVKRHVTVLFVDIRGFTTMSEKLEPEQVVSILNEYLNLCAEAIFKYEGTLDKYIGDAAMALFGAPLEIEDHAFKAVQTAYYMQKGAETLSGRLTEKYGRTVSFGVGVNTGYAIVGNIGASHRLDYTAIGDAVNTAARLESNAKPGQVLISADTYELVKDRVDVHALGSLNVKGKIHAIEVYELIGIKNEDEGGK
ncbi:MAG: adenylate/guanylate cyclase domain-containing protein [Bacillota bacterium]|nr:adenylate/guanylate cyclase domain-containing protein [Bacillota bacterium]